MRSPLHSRRPGLGVARGVALAIALVCVLVCALSGCDATEPSAPEPEHAVPAADAVRQPSVPEFADPGSCVGCHPAAQAAWSGSHHDHAIDRATSETVLADFAGTAFTLRGRTTRFRRDGDRFLVEAEGPDGQQAEFEVAYTFGVEPLQQYLIRFPGGRLQSLTVAWDTEKGAWFSLYPDEDIPAGDPLHWTGPLQRWNTMCAECHSTALSRGYDVATGVYEAEWVALDVSCQACHGPAGAHVAWARELEPGEAVSPGADRRLATDLSRGAAGAEIDACAPCHSRRHAVSARAVPGEPFLDHFAPELLRPDLYHVDGQIDGEVYVWGSFVQSRMYARGVRCSDCHDPHTLALRAEGNAVCTRCHAPEPDPRFETLAKRDYDSSDHHFHPPGSPGAACVVCHMPSRTYMQVDPRRDHSLRVPRPDLAVRLGTPDACSDCHVERGPQWAADFLAARASAPPRPHFGEAIAAGRSGQPDALSRLLHLATDPAEPAIARATAIEMLAGAAAHPDVGPMLIAAAAKDDPLLRVSAARALEGVDPARGVPVLAQMTRDERRAVRIEAARALSGLPLEELSPDRHADFTRALDEYRSAQQALGDTPEAHLNLGVLSARRGRPTQAEADYRTALRLQPDFVPARVNLANLLNAQGRNEEAEGELRAALAAMERLSEGLPDEGAPRHGRGEIHYSLGLLLAETGRLEEATTALAEAAAILESRPRVQYNYGLSLQQLGRRAEAEQALQRAAALAPADPNFQHALAVLYAQDGRRSEALRHAQRVVELTGGAPGTRELVQQIEALPPAP